MEFFSGVAIAVSALFLGWLSSKLYAKCRKPIGHNEELLLEEMPDTDELLGPLSFSFTEFSPLNVDESKIPSNPSAWQKWAYENGGEDVSYSLIEITIQGYTDDAVSIERPYLIPCGAAERESDSHFGVGGIGGGSIIPRIYTFELDGTSKGRIYPEFNETHDRSMRFKLHKGDTESFLIRVHVTGPLRHQWKIAIPYTRNNKAQKPMEVTRSHGSPFATIGAEGLEQWCYDDGWYKSLS